ncbi:MAG: STAS domain-containing protein [Candidatus Omnitrophica bacterium]|nr:STAS domain-containing protein [Candidatus Omnitrophota bacterium]
MKVEISLEKINDITLVSLNGELNLDNTHRVREAFKKILKQRKAKVLLDFDNVPFIDSSGIALLIEIVQAFGKSNGAMCLCHVNKKILSVFEITKVSKLFNIFDSHEEALRSF